MKTRDFLSIVVLLFMVHICISQSKDKVTDISNCSQTINQKQQELWNQLSVFQKEYFPNEEQEEYKWNYNFSKNEITVTKNNALYLKIDFIHVGSIDVNQKKWTWFWASNTNNKSLEKVKEFGRKNKCKKLINPSWKGLEKDAWQMVAISNFILKSKGGARHYTRSKYDYVIFTKIQKL